MGRESMVTRTIITTNVTCLCLDVETAEPSNVKLVLAGTFKDKKTALKAFKKIGETETLKAVQVVDMTENETLYGMTESDFIKNAKILPPRGTKATDTNNITE